MRDNVQVPVVIFSLNRGSREADLDWIHSFVSPEVNPKELVGAWEGEEELSYMVTVDVWRKHEREFVQLLKKTFQDAVLYLDNQRNAWLLYRRDNYDIAKGHFFGEFKNVHKLVALRSPGWTLDPQSGAYFTVC